MPSHETYFDLIDRDAAGWRIFLLTDEGAVQKSRSTSAARPIA
jgi:hypothetical protein